MSALYERKTGANRGKPRLWLEGACLSDNGWARGDRFDVVEGAGRLSYVKRAEGKRKVAGTVQRPIIDTNGALVGECLGEKGTVCLVSVSRSAVDVSVKGGAA